MHGVFVRLSEKKSDLVENRSTQNRFAQRQ
jgi:hypothetical protein